jgi:hypothetical protein
LALGRDVVPTASLTILKQPLATVQGGSPN